MYPLSVAINLWVLIFLQIAWVAPLYLNHFHPWRWNWGILFLWSFWHFLNGSFFAFHWFYRLLLWASYRVVACRYSYSHRVMLAPLQALLLVHVFHYKSICRHDGYSDNTHSVFRMHWFFLLLLFQIHRIHIWISFRNRSLFFTKMILTKTPSHEGVFILTLIFSMIHYDHERNATSQIS